MYGIDALSTKNYTIGIERDVQMGTIEMKNLPRWRNLFEMI